MTLLRGDDRLYGQFAMQLEYSPKLEIDATGEFKAARACAFGGL
jgi:hypothetical protein